MALVVGASVGLKWVLQEPDGHLAEALVRSEPDLLVPDFWLNEAANVLWLQARRKLFTPDETREGLALLRARVEPTPTAHMRLHDLALDFSIAIDHSTYDTLCLAFAVAMDASAVVTADRPFLRSIRPIRIRACRRWCCRLRTWARSQGGGASPAE